MTDQTTAMDWTDRSQLLDKFRPGDVLVAASLLTRLPVKVDHAAAGARGAQASWAYPLIGAGLGLAAGLVFAALSGIGVAAGVAAGAAIAISLLLTGALHEDGLADTADGFGAGVEKTRTLEIMRDSRIGAFGASALVVILLARWSAVASFSPWEAIAALVAAGALSRAAMVALMWSLPPARPDGLGAGAGEVSTSVLLVALAIALLATLPTGWSILLAPLAAAAAVILVARLADSKIGGHTGDVMGAGQQAAEVAVLAVLTIA
ncbi:MAG: adenosylcobinamide-GDP ribazoletransferase [Pseudomonadota bacterium]